jgi:ubiquinone/menaquinone biosynthesis C-methylase UbiE
VAEWLVEKELRMDQAAATPIDVWNEVIAPKYIRFRHILVDGLAMHGKVAISKRGPASGERVLDVGCGLGDSTIDLAKMVGPEGRAVGIDCCDPFLEFGRKDAAVKHVTNVSFENADAATKRFEPAFDFCFSRFGTMFFASPVAAMRNVRTALRPGGRLLMVVWRQLDDNEWMALPKRIALKHLPPPDDQAPNCGPGPFSMASRDVVTDILSAAGFIDIELERHDAQVTVGKTIDDAIDFQLAMGPAGEIVREAGPLGEAKRPLVVEELHGLIAPLMTPGGVVMGSSSWAVSARSPS